MDVSARRALHRVSAGRARRARGARHNGGLVNPQGRKARGRSGSRTKRSFSAVTAATLPTDRYVKAPNGRFTPQTLPGRAGLDARLGLLLMLCAQRLDLA